MIFFNFEVKLCKDLQFSGIEILHSRLYILVLRGWMMINHSTLEYHVTNLNTFLRWLWRKNQNPNTLL